MHNGATFESMSGMLVIYLHILSQKNVEHAFGDGEANLGARSLVRKLI